MSPPTGPRPDPQDLRTTLLAHAIDLARAGGPDAVSIRDVQRRAGVSHNAAYRHYADRSALLDAVSGHASLALAERMRLSVDQAGASESPARRLRALGRGYVEFALADPGLYATVCWARDPGMDAAPHTDDTSPFRLLADCLDDMTAAGELTAERRDYADVAAWSATHGLASLILDGPLKALGTDEREHAVDRVLDMLVIGLCGEIVRPAALGDAGLHEAAVRRPH